MANKQASKSATSGGLNNKDAHKAEKKAVADQMMAEVLRHLGAKKELEVFAKNLSNITAVPIVDLTEDLAQKSANAVMSVVDPASRTRSRSPTRSPSPKRPKYDDESIDEENDPDFLAAVANSIASSSQNAPQPQRLQPPAQQPPQTSQTLVALRLRAKLTIQQQDYLAGVSWTLTHATIPPLTAYHRSMARFGLFWPISPSQCLEFKAQHVDQATWRLLVRVVTLPLTPTQLEQLECAPAFANTTNLPSVVTFSVNELPINVDWASQAKFQRVSLDHLSGIWLPLKLVEDKPADVSWVM